MFVSKNFISVEQQHFLFGIEQSAFHTQQKGYNAYHIMWLQTHIPFDFVGQFWCFDMLEFIETQVISYHMLNFVIFFIYGL